MLPKAWQDHRDEEAAQAHLTRSQMPRHGSVPRSLLD
jgi:hypothetical protein